MGSTNDWTWTVHLVPVVLHHFFGELEAEGHVALRQHRHLGNPVVLDLQDVEVPLKMELKFTFFLSELIKIPSDGVWSNFAGHPHHCTSRPRQHCPLSPLKHLMGQLAQGHKGVLCNNPLQLPGDRMRNF